MRAAWLVLAALLSVASSSGYHGKGGDYDPRVGPGMSIVAKFEMGGVKGSVCFTQDHPSDPVTITVKLNGLEQFAPEMYPWGVYEYPIKFGNYPDFPCSDLGSIYNPPIPCPVNDTCIYGNFTEKHGRLRSTNMAQVFKNNETTLFGPNSLVGRSVCIQRDNGEPYICANIEYQGISLQAMRAAFGGIGNFSSNLTGDVIFRRANGRSGTTLNVCLSANCGYSPPDETINWSLRTGTCDNLGPVLGSATHPDEVMMGAFTGCSRDNPRACPAGDLTTKCGPVTLVPGANKYRGFCNDDQLGLVPLSQLQDTVLVFSINNTIIDCQLWEPVKQQCARVTCVKRPRVYMDILFYQSDPGDRTHVRSFVIGLDGNKAYLQIRNKRANFTDCSDLGSVFDKPGARFVGAPFGKDPTGDALPVGTLEFKISSIRGEQSLRKGDTTSWLPLFGPYSIIGKSLALYDENGNVVTCCDIELMSDPSPSMVASILGYTWRK